MEFLDKSIEMNLKCFLQKLEEHFGGDVISFYGPIYPYIEKIFRDFIEDLKNGENKNKRIIIFLNTSGGLVETTEKLVYIIRHHYKEVYFVIPDYAMSAGTIWCMSGDKIFMDYSSCLGPIDTQILNAKDKLVPALGYLDKVSEFIYKSRNNTLTDLEVAYFLNNIDLAELRFYEQAKDLTISLLKEWLVKYKFKNWKKHRTNPEKIGKAVTKKEKEKRAEEIAEKLNDTKHWHSHGRAIGIKILQDYLKLEIENYSSEKDLTFDIRSYNDILIGYINRMGYKYHLHSRKEPL